LVSISSLRSSVRVFDFSSRSDICSSTSAPRECLVYFLCFRHLKQQQQYTTTQSIIMAITPTMLPAITRAQVPEILHCIQRHDPHGPAEPFEPKRSPPTHCCSVSHQTQSTWFVHSEQFEIVGQSVAALESPTKNMVIRRDESKKENATVMMTWLKLQLAAIRLARTSPSASGRSVLSLE